MSDFLTGWDNEEALGLQRMATHEELTLVTKTTSFNEKNTSRGSRESVPAVRIRQEDCVICMEPFAGDIPYIVKFFEINKNVHF